MKVKYPLSIQTFREVIERGFVYVDKTPQIAALRDAGKYFFLARPRRFGKSMTVSTMVELYSGDRELFKGTWAYDNWDFEARHSSVIWLQLASSGFGEDGLTVALHRMLSDNARRLGVELPRADADRDGDSDGTAARFRELIRAAAAVSPSGKTVVLIDEYDKPITDYIARDDGMAMAEAHREQLRWFFSPLKDADLHLELVFITGITAFSKVSLFSEVNNLINLSLHPLAHTIVGITQAELDALFGAEVAATGVAPERVREYYNGYAFGAGAERVYNPWSLFGFLLHGQLTDDWYGSGTPAWLVRHMAEAGEVAIEDEVRTHGQLLNFDLRRLDTAAILYQTGYLTIDDYDSYEEGFRLRFPNLEIARAFQISLVESYLSEDSPNARRKVIKLRNTLRTGDLAAFIETLNRALADVPHGLWAKHDERTFHLIAHVLLWGLTSFIRSEVPSARGRADSIVEFDDRVFCFEFKVDPSAERAVDQILDRGYLDAYAGDGRQRVAVGISFDKAKRQVGEWVERVI